MPRSHVLKRIRLDLARSKQHPNGSSSCGYDLVAPLDGRGLIDVEAWQKTRDRCMVRRFWDGQDDRTGRLTHKSGGAEGARWVIDYDEERLDDDEAGYRLGSHAFVPGEYVTIGGQEGSHTFRVIAVENA
jgi:hypothetical protein